MRSLGDLTGPPRDLDVQVLEWDDQVAALGDGDATLALAPLRRQLVADRTAAHDDLARSLGGADVRRLLDRWDELLAHPMDPAQAGHRGGDPIGAVVGARIKRAQRRLVRNGRAISADTPGERLHDVRKDAKKLRYLLECFAGVLPKDGRKAFVKRLKRLQDLLGEHQDAEVQAANLHVAADELPATTPAATYVAVGRLIEQLELTRQTRRDDFAARFADYDSAPTRAALGDMLAGLES
jgi:CHAD domain-containing protein